MRSELAWVAALYGGCAFGKAPGPTSVEGIVLNLVSDRLVDEAEQLVPPSDGGALFAGADALLFEEETEDGRRAVIGVPDGGTLRRAEVAGFDASAMRDVRLARVDGSVLAWACRSDGGASGWVLPPGADEAAELLVPGGCPSAFAEAPGGGLVGAEWTYDGFEVRTWALERGALRETSATLLAADTAFEAWRVGVDGDRPWVIGGSAETTVWSDPDGSAVYPVGNPPVVARDGRDVLVSSSTGTELHRWTPSTGAEALEGRIEVPTDRLVRVDDRDGLVSQRQELLGQAGLWPVEGWWVTPGAGGYAADPMPTSPCTDEEAALDVGTWSVVAVLETSEGRLALWGVSSWLGPGAMVVAPF